MCCAALAVVHYKLAELEQSQDLYARAYDIQVSHFIAAQHTGTLQFFVLVLVELARRNEHLPRQISI